MIETAKPDGEVEAALLIQIACTHAAAMAVLFRIGGAHGGDRHVAMMAAAASKLLRVYALQVEALRRLRAAGSQYMRIEHIHDGWWELPGEPVPELGWPGTKNAQSHRVWLPEAARRIIDDIGAEEGAGFVFAGARGRPVRKLADAMREICKKLGITDKVTPHDLRRTHGSTITALGFGRDAMNRIQNHVEGGIASVYDRHQYADENRRIMEAVAARIMALALGEGGADNVVLLRR